MGAGWIEIKCDQPAAASWDCHCQTPLRGFRELDNLRLRRRCGTPPNQSDQWDETTEQLFTTPQSASPMEMTHDWQMLQRAGGRWVRVQATDLSIWSRGRDRTKSLLLLAYFRISQKKRFSLLPQEVGSLSWLCAAAAVGKTNAAFLSPHKKKNFWELPSAHSLSCEETQTLGQKHSLEAWLAVYHLKKTVWKKQQQFFLFYLFFICVLCVAGFSCDELEPPVFSLAASSSSSLTPSLL